MIAFVFPGQGSQRQGMGETLFGRYPDMVARADAVLGYSIAELTLRNPEGRLDQTEFTQPAVFVVNALAYLERMEQLGRRPDYVAGHSLGEYNALLAADVFDFETALTIVRQRARLMAAARGGGMAAIIGLTAPQVSDVLQSRALSTIDLANHNAPDQVVIAGPRDAVQDALPLFKAAGASACIPLRTSGAFHSRYMREAQNEFGLFLERFQFRDPAIPVVANVLAEPYTRDCAAALLTSQLTSPVLWSLTVEYLLRRGVQRFEEIGPGRVLTGLIEKVRASAPPASPPAPAIQARAVPRDGQAGREITAESLGSAEFRAAYSVKYAYIAGAMYKGIASADLVIRMGRAGMIGYLGTGGMRLPEIEAAIRRIQQSLGTGEAYGMNLLCNLVQPDLEDKTVDLFLQHGIRNVEAAAYMSMTPPLVRFRLAGAFRERDGTIGSHHRIIAKVSRPEVAEVFMSPPPDRIVRKLVEAGRITPEQAELGRSLPVSEDVCVEADSGGHTDQGIALVLMPAMLRLRDEMMARHGYRTRIRIGAAGGLGAPESAAAAFVLGADFILTGSINQCTVEAGTSDAAKDMLQGMNVQDTEYAPAGDMFEIGARIQVLKKGLFFAARANKLYELYRRYNSLDELDEKTARQIQDKYFQRSFDEVWRETRAYLQENLPGELAKAEQSPKYKMSLIFRWYFVHSARLAASGSADQKVDYQIQCGPALGAFNAWVKGTPLESWRNRHVDEIAEKLMLETAALLNRRFGELRGLVMDAREGQPHPAHV